MSFDVWKLLIKVQNVFQSIQIKLSYWTNLFPKSYLMTETHSLPLSRKSGFCPEFGQTAKTARFLSRKIGNLQYPLNSRKIKGVWGNIEENEAVFRPIFPIFIPNFGLWWKNRDKSQKIGLKIFLAAFGRTDYSVESCIFSRFLSRFRD